MAQQYLSDSEVFGGQYLSEDEVLGTEKPANSEQDNPLKRGWNKMVQSVGITKALATGDTEDAAQRIAEAERYQAANPGTPEGQELSAAWQRGEGISGGISEVAGEFKKDWQQAPGVVSGLREVGKNALAMGSGIVEQTPNMIAPMAGLVGGVVVGGAAGSAVPVIGNAAGAVVGGFTGATGGNTLVEGGGMAREAIAKAGIDPTDTVAVKNYLDKNGDTILTQAGVKGAVIGAVDMATMGLGGRILTAPARQAAGRALVDMGVDVTDKVAVKAAMQSPDLAARVAVDPLYVASKSGAGNAARNAGAFALEPAGEFAGEFLGQGMATGDYDTKNAFLEAASSLGQSGIMFAGQKAYAAIKYPFSYDKDTSTAPPEDLSKATPAAQAPIVAKASKSFETDEANKALFTAPKSLSAIDRVSELDKEEQTVISRLSDLADEKNGYGQTFDTEREELSGRLEELHRERENITSTWPKAIQGAESTFSTETGARLGAKYALMEAGDLITSHDENLRATPNYPPELQPRERDRAASEMQISGIVQKLDPARLGESADAATGAPIVGADGLVESGNARTIALKRVYQASGQKAEDYKDFIKGNAEKLGFTAQDVEKLKNPVLVRVRTTPVNRAEFARQANASTVAQMSPSEQARSDSARIDVMDDLSPDDNGEFSTSRSFIRRFVGRLPGTEQSGMMDANGNLSQSGYSRIRNAILAKAYGDSPVLLRMVESMDDNLRNITKALVKVAPDVAKTRQSIAEGALFDSDITPDLLAAVEEMSVLREQGKSVTEELKQQGIFGDKYSPETREILAFLNENIRRPKVIAEFIQRYMEALQGAGNPNQGSLLGDVAAPAKSDLLTAARKDPYETAGQGGYSAEEAGGQGGLESIVAPGDDVRNQGNAQAGGQGTGEWVAFGPETGTLGIPRAEMPQIKGEHRGALIQFLDGRGINHKTVEMPANRLKPTQAEFSKKKVEGWKEVREGTDRSVLASSDGYILDGHHQWVAALANNETEQVIQFNVPIKELLAAVYQFPSAYRSEGANVVELQAKAKQDFNDALSDLADIASRHTKAAMVPENTPELMPTLVKLSEAAIKIVGYQAKDIIAYVKKALKDDPRFKKFWNKVSDQTYRKAAMQAAEQESATRVDDLFTMAERRQQDLFNTQGDENGRKVQGQETAQKVSSGAAMINGRPYDMASDNFKEPNPKTFMAADVLQEAEEFVRKYWSKKEDPYITPEERSDAEEKLGALLKKAAEIKVEYDQKVIDIAQRLGLSQQLAGLKGMDRAVIKLVKEENGNISGMKDVLRSTIVVSDYSQAQAVLDEIVKEFNDIPRPPKNRTGGTPLKFMGIDLPLEDLGKSGNYRDVLVNVRLPNGVIAEIQINIPEMLGAKYQQGHKLYEAFRDAPKESALGQEINASMFRFYDAAFAAAKSRHPLAYAKNAASSDGKSDSGLGNPFGTSNAPSSEIPNTLPSGNTTRSSPPNESKNSQPSGNLSGTLISTSDVSISKQDANSYTNDVEKSIGGENEQQRETGSGSAQRQVAGATQKSAAKRGAQPVPEGSSGNDLFGSGEPDATAADTAEVGQAPTGRMRGKNADGASAKSGSGAKRPAGIPAGRDIPLKSGRNYRFGPGDLTYEGSWYAKAAQNVEAVELLKALEKDGKKATREEQSILAKFIGWGSSEIANTIFGDKIDAQVKALNEYDQAIELLGDKPYLTNARYSDYMPAFNVLKAKNPNLNWYTAGNITKAMLEEARPDQSVRKWADLRDRLRKVMTEDEWKEASRSTQYAHYTSKPIVESMMLMLSRMGFAGGAIVEPGAGIGVFPGLMPADMATNSVYTGIEFDSITGGILKQLFPDERVLVESFIDSKLPENYYDIGFGNPPFGNIPILSDPKYKKQAFSLHDYFFAKTMDSVKPGGLVVFVTSRFTMDKLSDKARDYLSNRADLVGAIRLPQTAFKKNAGTDVVTDVLILRKKVPGETFEHSQPWAKSIPIKINGREYPINEYFHAHPEMVLGKNSDKGKMANSPDPQYTVEDTGGDIEAMFDKAASLLPANIFKVEQGTAAEAAKVREIDFNPKAKKEGNYYLSDSGVVMIREGGMGVPAKGLSEKDAPLIKDFISLRDALKQAHYDQLNDGDWEPSLKALQKEYKSFVKKHGQVNQFTTYMQKIKVEELDEEGNPTGQKVWDEEQRYRYPLLNKFRDDPDYTLVAALETITENDGTLQIKESHFLTDRVLGKPDSKPASTPTDALLQVLNDTGEVDIDMIADRMNLSKDDTIAALGPLVYKDPNGGWKTADEYLSGNVRKKLKLANEAVKTDRSLERNVEALLSVQPALKTAADIKPQIGMSWIPERHYEQFLREKTGVHAKVLYNTRTGQWAVQVESGHKTLQATQDWGTPSRNAAEILEHALTGSPIRVSKTISIPGGGTKQEFDAESTEAANAKLQQMREAFQTWIWQDQERIDELVPIYNDKFNNIVQRKFDGSHMTLPGTSKRWSVFDHVKRGAWRIIQSGNTYLAHAVGSGKTFQMIISAMEQKRLGMIKKPMMVVPNHMLAQFAREWQDLYPAARLMVADEQNFTGDNRRRFVSRVALSDLDGVIITQSAFKLLDLDPAFKQKMIEQELDYLRAAYTELGENPDKLTFTEGARKDGSVTVKINGSKSRDPKVKQIEQKIQRMEEKLRAAMSSEGKDKNVRFDEMGVDMLYVDEAHEYRKLAFTTQRQVKGIDSSGSDKAFDLYMKTQWLRENKNSKRYLVMASGTPVTNTMAELYTVQRYMAPDVLEERGLEEFDQWASMFGSESTSIEPDASGKYSPVTRFNKFVNVGELTQMFREFADVLTSDYLASLLGDKRPKVAGGSRKMEITPKTEDYADFQENELKPRMEASRKWKPSREEQNNPDPIIVIIGDGRLAAIDMRFMNPSLPSNPDSKLNKLIDGVIETYKSTADWEYKDKATGEVEKVKGATQIVFSDLGFGEGVSKNRGFNARAWFEKRLRDAGIPPAHVAFMSDYKKSAAKLKLFKDINAGRVRIVVGSSKNMGTGVNAQQRLIALHHLDAPWYPADVEQREGRIVRQGNKNPEVKIFAYATKGSYDEQMWSTLARKQFFIDQALSGDPNIREIEDLGEASQFDIAAAMVADDPRVLQLAGMKAEIEKLQRLQRAHEDQKLSMQRDYNLSQLYIDSAEKQLPDAEKVAAKVEDLSGSNFKAVVDGKKFTERKEFGAALLERYKALADRLVEGRQKIGSMSGFDITYSGKAASENRFFTEMNLDVPPEPMFMEGSATSSDPVGLSLRLSNAISALAKKPDELKRRIVDHRAKMDAIAPRLDTAFPMRQMLLDKVLEADALEADIVASSKAAEVTDPGEEPALSRSADAPAGMKAADVQKLTDKIRAKWKNAPDIVVVESMSDKAIPKPVRDENERQLSQGAAGRPEGFFYKGKVYLVADQLRSDKDVARVLFHETLGHFGLRGAFGTAFKPILHDLAKNRRSEVVAKAKQYGLDPDNINDLLIAAEEVLAELAQTHPNASYVKRAIALIRQVLRDIGIDLKLTDNDIIATYLIPARRFVENGGKPGGGIVFSRGVRFSQGISQADTIDVDGVARPVQNSNGQRIAQTDEGLRNFWQWFGDSKVVDEQGRPLVVYHGTDSEFTMFEPGRVGAMYFTPDTGYAQQYGKVILPVYIRVNKIADLTDSNSSAYKLSVKAFNKNGGWSANPDSWDYLQSEGRTSPNFDPYKDLTWEMFDLPETAVDQVLRESEYDGVKLEERRGIDSYAVFDPTQIKSATGNQGTFDPDNPDIRYSRATEQTAQNRADAIIAESAATWRPVDTVLKATSQALHVDTVTKALIQDIPGMALREAENRIPGFAAMAEKVRAGMVADYGVPDAVIDQRVMMQGRQKVQLRKAGQLIDKLATLTREESRVAYEWMNSDDPESAEFFRQQLPEESIKTLAEIEQMIDKLSQEAVALGQLDPEAFKRNRYSYLRRSYVKHTMELTKGEAAKRQRAISILGDQYKGRGMVDGVEMSKIKSAMPDWWGRKYQSGKADKGLKGERFVRLENRQVAGSGTETFEGMKAKDKGKLRGVAYWPAGEAIPAKYAGWSEAGTWNVIGTKGDKLLMWRDFTKQERVAMGEIDEARYAIAKTLHGMVHDVETGRYLQWLSQCYAKVDADSINGEIVEASERMLDTFKPGEWVKVPDTTISGTSVKRYGNLAGRYLPGPIWNDVRQVVAGQFRPLGDVYAEILKAWKISKTALSPAVHTNNVMANMVMADWHDVSAGHVLKSLRILMGASEKDGTGIIGRAGNVASKAGIADKEAAQEILNRYQDSGGNLGTWATAELQREQLAPLLEALEKELGTTGETQAGKVGVMVAMQKVLQLKLPEAWEALRLSSAGQKVTNEGKNLLALYEAEDQVFRLAAWLKAKEEGKTDMQAGQVARKSFLDYHINAPWVQMMRSTVFPFISFFYRAAPMLIDTAANKPWKLMKLGLLVGTLNALGYMASGGDEDDERKYLPEEKAGKIFGVVPKLVRMPWNDSHGSPVFLDIRRFVPVGDIFDTGATNAAIPILPFAVPAGPMAVLAEIMTNKSQFTGRAITLETDTGFEKAQKVFDHLYKAFAPNIIVLPGSHAWTATANASSGKTDAFGREQSTAQAVAGSFGVKLGSYPKDVLRLNATRQTMAKLQEINANISKLRRERSVKGITEQEFKDKVQEQLDKKRQIIEDFQEGNK